MKEKEEVKTQESGRGDGRTVMQREKFIDGKPSWERMRELGGGTGIGKCRKVTNACNGYLTKGRVSCLEHSMRKRKDVCTKSTSNKK